MFCSPKSGGARPAAVSSGFKNLRNLQNQGHFFPKQTVTTTLPEYVWPLNIFAWEIKDP